MLVCCISLQAQVSNCGDIAPPAIANISSGIVNYTWQDEYRFSEFTLQYFNCDEVPQDDPNSLENILEGCPVDIWIEVPGPTKKGTFEPCNMYSFRMMAICFEDTVYSAPAHYYYDTKVCKSCINEPISNLDWLQDLVNQHTNLSNTYELYTNCIAGQSVFNLSAVDCCNQQSIIYDESGNVLCNATANDLPCERLKTLSRSKLIWTNQNNFFENYPWLNNIIGDNECTNKVIINEYVYNIYTFLHIQYPTGEADLYFQNGTYYCSDTKHYSCIEGYQFGDPVARLMCHDISTSGPTEPQSQTLFDSYNWLQNIVDPEDCFATITEYAYSENYHFIFIETPTASNLYYQDGTLYCTNTPHYSCLEAYGFTSPVSRYNCNQVANKTLAISSESTTVFSIYPNPSVGILSINLSNTKLKNLNLQLFDAQGKLLKQFTLSNQTSNFQVDLSHWAKGVYFITVQNEVDIETKKIILH